MYSASLFYWLKFCNERIKGHGSLLFALHARKKVPLDWELIHITSAKILLINTSTQIAKLNRKCEISKQFPLLKQLIWCICNYTYLLKFDYSSENGFEVITLIFFLNTRWGNGFLCFWVVLNIHMNVTA